MNTAPVERRGGGGFLPFVIGGLLVLVLIIGWVVYSGGVTAPSSDTKVDVDVDIPAPQMPDLPEAPSLPPVEPPSVPAN
ncbi:hypothetical protein JIP62_04420 [Brevundimonas vitis]|uniref:Sporulation protein n=1 Tax=Brevundimonas vitisensis TaxID=2800818 RepID=A0ABX7BV86_9CAUL|nr:hypothetical protein JIP62_04420 [Brevundimonas vitisensis]